MFFFKKKVLTKYSARCKAVSYLQTLRTRQFNRNTGNMTGLRGL